MANKPRRNKLTSGRREVTTGKDQKKRERFLINSNARSWLGKLWTLIRFVDCVRSIYEKWGENPFF